MKKGQATPPEVRAKQSAAAIRRFAGRRIRDSEEKPGAGVYSTWEYREARKRLVEGKPCVLCGGQDRVHAHHETPGDDSSLIPLCVSCHPKRHGQMRGAKGPAPLPHEVAPLCACGCGQPVHWKRVRGWARFRKGHGCAKVPAGTRLQSAPLCACGCGGPTKFRYGRGWNKFRRGHDQRVFGAYRYRTADDKDRPARTEG